MPFDPRDPDTWTASDAAEVERALEMLDWYENFDSFAQAFWDLADPAPLVFSWHMSTICRESQAMFEESMRRRAQYDAIVRECGRDHALRDRRIVEEIDSTPLRLVLLIPPRGSKSTLISKLFVLWCWARQATQFLAFSAMESKIPEFGISIRDLVRSDRYQEWMAFLGQAKLGAKMVVGRRDSDATIKLTLSNGGQWGGHPIGGRFTGKNADVMLIDDPHDIEETMGKMRSTESKAAAVAKVEDVYRSKINDRYNLRMVGMTILIMQRVHLRDLAQVMIEEGARVVTIPADVVDIEEFRRIKHPDDPRTEVGQSYNPARLPPSELRRLAVNDPFGYATKFLMRPTLQEGSKIKREWFDNKVFHGDVHEMARDCHEVTISVDSASSTGRRSDYTSMGVWGRQGARRMLLDRRFGKWGSLDLKKQFVELVRAWPEAAFKLIENKSSGQHLIQEMEQLGIPGIVPINPSEPKPDRLQYAIAALEAGNIWLPANAPWRQEYVDNMVGIGAGGAHDDDGDMTSQVMKRWASSVAPWLTPEMRAALTDLRPSLALGDYVFRWDRRDQVRSRLRLDVAPNPHAQMTDPVLRLYVGVVPGWAIGRQGTEAVASIVDPFGVQVSMVECGSGGIEAFSESLAQELAYYDANVTVRYAELPGMPSTATVASIKKKGIGVSTRPQEPNKAYKYAGLTGAGYTARPEQTTALWTTFLNAIAEGKAKIRDPETMAHLETVVEKKGVPVMPNDGPVTGRVLAYLLACEAAANARTSEAASGVHKTLLDRVYEANGAR